MMTEIKNLEAIQGGGGGETGIIDWVLVDL